MPALITVLGSCLVAASGAMYSWSAVAADRPANPPGEPWWNNPPTATGTTSGPGLTDPGPADHDQGDKAPDTLPAAGSGARIAEVAPPGGAGLVAEFAPDPPGTRHSDGAPARGSPAAFQQDAAAAGTPAASKPATGTPAEKAKAADHEYMAPAASAADHALRPPQQLPATQSTGCPAPAASPLSVAPATGEAPGCPPAGRGSPATTPSSPAGSPESAAPLGLGSHNDKNAQGKSSPLSAMITVGGSLAIVLGLFFIVAWAMRKTAPRGSLVLPKEVFEILGRAPLGARQQVQLLRCGNKLLLVSITPNGTETLTEVTDPLDVDRIAGICQQAHPKSATTAFRQVFQQLAPASGEPSELDNLEPPGTRRKRYRWEEKHA